MAGLFRGALSFICVAILAGSFLAADLPNVAKGFQRALVVEVYKSLTALITPISSMFGDGIMIQTELFTASSNNGAWPIVTLLLAGVIVRLVTNNMGTAIITSFTGSATLLISWQLLSFLTVPMGSVGYSWVNELDEVFYSLIYNRPLEIPTLLTSPAVASMVASLFLDQLTGAEREQREGLQYGVLFPWRRRERKT